MDLNYNKLYKENKLLKFNSGSIKYNSIIILKKDDLVLSFSVFFIFFIYFGICFYLDIQF